MKRFALLASALFLAGPALAAPDFSGSWEVGVREFGDKNYYLPMQDGRLLLEAHGDSYTGRFNQISFTGSLEKDGLHLSCDDRGQDCGRVILQLSGNRLSGKGDLIARSPALSIPVTVEGKRPAARPKGPTMHDYDPQAFHNFYSPSLTPALHLFPGDSVTTRTLDSRGQDRDGRPRAPRGNPLTGPFYVEGAMPGDTLVVHLDRVRTNRDSAYQSNLVATTALETGAVQDQAKYESGFATWKIDAATGTAFVVNPDEKLAPYTIKLSPMLGCVGVAPPHDETLGAGHLGVFGGNLDSPEIREGVTLYFPVFQRGGAVLSGRRPCRAGRW
jgi:amidase